MTPLTAWQNFYVIVGSAAGALTGLQFVVMALVADLPARRRSSQTTDAFGTPTVVHFGAALLLAGICSAPWGRVGVPAALLGVCGLVGVVYVLIVARRARTQTGYTPVFEDWLFHVLLPAVAYVMVGAPAYVPRSYVEPAFFAVGIAALLLLFIGIHNSWDTVTYILELRTREAADRPAGRTDRPL